MPLMSFDNPNSDAARQFLLDRRTERLHPKRHRTQKRAKPLGKAKRQRIKAKNAFLYKERSRFLNEARAYWAGLANGHPAARHAMESET